MRMIVIIKTLYLTADACAALADLMYGLNECKDAIQAVPGLTERLVALLGRGTTRVKESALIALKNMLSGNDEQVRN